MAWSDKARAAAAAARKKGVAKPLGNLGHSGMKMMTPAQLAASKAKYAKMKSDAAAKKTSRSTSSILKSLNAKSSSKPKTNVVRAVKVSIPLKGGGYASGTVKRVN